MGKMNLSKILVIDLEATCWENGVHPNGELQKDISEIIEIGVCEIQRQTGVWKIGNKKSYFVKPVKYPVSKYCTELTGIDDTLLKKEGMPFEQALRSFNKHFSPRWKTAVAWGNYDLHQIKKECMQKGLMNLYQFSPTYINAKNLFALRYTLDKEVGLSNALRIANLEFIGKPHSGCDDAYNTARLFQTLI